MDIAVIGGSGLSELGAGKVLADLDTPYGQPSSPLIETDVAGSAVAFLARHGKPHQVPPHKVNYRANIWALKQLGVSKIVAFNAVGGINPDWADGTLVLPDQLIDYSYGREHTFYDGEARVPMDEALAHIEFGNPLSTSLRSTLVQAAAQIGQPLIPQGTYAVTQGPRLETAAEVARLARDGCDIVGMTLMPEAALARELDIEYASICLVVNAAAGVGDEPISMQAINTVLEQGVQKTVALIGQAIKLIG